MKTQKFHLFFSTLLYYTLLYYISVKFHASRAPQMLETGPLKQLQKDEALF